MHEQYMNIPSALENVPPGWGRCRERRDMVTTGKQENPRERSLISVS
jgi:hypothetical protein